MNDYMLILREYARKLARSLSIRDVQFLTNHIQISGRTHAIVIASGENVNSVTGGVYDIGDLILYKRSKEGMVWLPTQYNYEHYICDNIGIYNISIPYNILINKLRLKMYGRRRKRRKCHRHIC